MNEIPKKMDESANAAFGETCGLPDEDNNARSLLKSGFAHYDKGEIHLALDDFTKVIQRVNKPLQANGLLESARGIRSVIYGTLGDFRKSLEDLDWLIENGYDAYFDRGHLRRRQK